MLSRELFDSYIDTLFEWGRQPDTTGMIRQRYWEALLATNPDEDELWAAIAQHIDNGKTVPTVSELKQTIWLNRKANTPQLPSANFEPMEAADATMMRMTIAACVLMDQGDTPFYRGFLRANAGVMGVPLFGSAIAHEDVAALAESGAVRARNEVFAPSGDRHPPGHRSPKAAPPQFVAPAPAVKPVPAVIPSQKEVEPVQAAIAQPDEPEPPDEVDGFRVGDRVRFDISAFSASERKEIRKEGSCPYEGESGTVVGFSWSSYGRTWRVCVSVEGEVAATIPDYLKKTEESP